MTCLQTRAVIEAKPATNWQRGKLRAAEHPSREGCANLLCCRDMEPLRIDVWSDIACPWCWVGKRHLEQAIAASGRAVQVVWRAYELNPEAPSAPPEGQDYVQRLADKYGVPLAQAQTMIDQMTSRGAGVGLDFHFDRAQATNTFDAHRLLAWAKTEGRQDALKEQLFAAYMSEGRLISDHDVLCQIAADAGLDADEAAQVLVSEAGAQQVRQDEASAQQMGVRGVPFFVFDGRVGVSGAQPASVLVEAMTEAGGAISAPEAEGCDAEGCSVPDSTPVC